MRSLKLASPGYNQLPAHWEGWRLDSHFGQFYGKKYAGVDPANNGDALYS